MVCFDTFIYCTWHLWEAGNRMAIDENVYVLYSKNTPQLINKPISCLLPDNKLSRWSSTI